MVTIRTNISEYTKLQKQLLLQLRAGRKADTMPANSNIWYL
jgi:hypothetical protein